MTNAYLNDFSTTVQTYYQDLSKYKPISREREKYLFERIKNSDINARQEIITSNLKFVFDVAKKYKGYGVALEDLISEGNLGLDKAINKFDSTKNIKFITYAVWWIRQAMQACIKDRSKIDKIEFNELGEEEAEINDTIMSDKEDEVVLHSEASNGEDEINRIEMSIEQKEIISRLLLKLPQKYRNVIIKYYGLNDTEEMTLDEIGEEMGLTKERVRQLKMSALKILRSEILMTNYSELSL